MKRLVTSALLIPTIIWVVLRAPDMIFAAAACLFAGLCWFEYAGIAAHYGARFRTSDGWIPGFAFLLIQRDEFLLLMAISMGVLMLALRQPDLKDSFPTAALYLLGILYVFGAWRSAFALHARNEYWLLFALTINWVGDTAAFYVGRWIGRHKLAPRVSPGKSWEGAIASLVAAAIFGVFFLQWAIQGIPVASALAVSVSGNAAGQMGDLVESALKRGAGVKDSGNLLPGHGGWLDRLDSSLFSMPAVHILVQTLGLR